MPHKLGSKKGHGARGGQSKLYLDRDSRYDFTASSSFTGNANRDREYQKGTSKNISSVSSNSRRGLGSSTLAKGRDFQGRGELRPQGRDSEYRNPLLEPIKFVPARITPRFLFKEDTAEHMSKTEIVVQGGRAPVVDVIEAAFTAQRDQQGSEEETSEDETSHAEAIVPSEPTNVARPQPPSLKELTKSDISSVVSLAAALKDTALTPREENIRPATLSVSSNDTVVSTTIGPLNPSAPSYKKDTELDSQKRSEDKRQAVAMEQPKHSSKASYNAALSDVESMLREFASNHSTHTLALPPMNKETRRRVHLLAECFGISAANKGSGSGQYIKLIRTNRTGRRIDEVKIRQLVRADNEAEGNDITAFNESYDRQTDGASKKWKIKPDAEIIGLESVKIGEDNAGYRLLGKMGWSEGSTMGKLKSDDMFNSSGVAAKQIRFGRGAASRLGVGAMSYR